MGTLSAVTRVRLSILAAVLAGTFAVPAAASASECPLPTGPVAAGHLLDDELSGVEQVFKGNFTKDLNGKFIQIPFDVPPNTTGMRIRYCYDEAAGNPVGIDNTTLDLGVYEPNGADPGNWTMAQRRGWSGSAVKIVGIGENGPTSTDDYNLNRKAYAPGNTTRAYKPGPVPEGEWAVELGAGYIDPGLTAGADWKVGVQFSTQPGWKDESFVASPYSPYVANAAPGWYTGDFHVHGENEPGNAPMTDTFDLGFGASGLDFLTLVDHNNDVARSSELGEYRALYPGMLIIPGTEMTTYDGHFNSHNSNVFTDFRLGGIYKWDDTPADGVQTDDELDLVRGPENPSSRFAQIRANGGISQINHPKIFANSPAACRGCAWTYTDGQTDFSKVSSIEIQTGPAGLPFSNPVAINPFTAETLAYYEHALATGNHIAAVGSSDDHKAGGGTNPVTDASVGHAATAVYADELSPSAITDAVDAGHTYVKFYGAAGPDVEMTGTGSATYPGTAIPGDSLTSDSMKFSVNVKKAGPSAASSGPYTLEILKDGVSVDSVTVTGDDFTYDSFSTSATGRYSFKVTHKVGGTNTLIDSYSTPIWFTYKAAPPAPTCETDASLCPQAKPSNKFKFKAVKLNKKKGTTRIKVKFPSAGKTSLYGGGAKKVKAKVKKQGQVIGLNVKPKSKLKKKLRKKGKAKVRVKVYFKPTGGTSRTKKKTVKLVLKKKAKKKHRR